MSVVQSSIEKEQAKITRMSVVMTLVGLLVPKMPLMEGIGSTNIDEEDRPFVNDFWRSKILDKRGNTMWKEQHMSDLYWTIGLSSLLGVGYTNIPMQVKALQKSLPDDGIDEGFGLQGQRLGNIEFLQQMYLYMEGVWRREEGFDIELKGSMEGLKFGVSTVNGTTLWAGIKLKQRRSVPVVTVTDGVSTEGPGWYCTEEIEEVIGFMTQMRMDNVETKIGPVRWAEFKDGKVMKTRGSTGYLPGYNRGHLSHTPVRNVRPRWVKVIEDLSMYDEYGHGEYTKQEIDFWLKTGYCPSVAKTIDNLNGVFVQYSEWGIKAAHMLYVNEKSYSPEVEIENFKSLPMHVQKKKMDEHNAKVLMYRSMSELVPGEWYSNPHRCDRRGRISALGSVTIQGPGVIRTQAEFAQKKKLG